jgi:4-amino-4-deoxy-L-arabinose transferase-like glycosyltransferase
MAKFYGTGDVSLFNPKIPALYPFLGSLVYRFVHDYELACTIVSLAASTALVAGVYGLSLRMHGRNAARIAALIVSIWPWLADYGCRVGPDALGCTLWVFSVLAFACGLRHSPWWLAGAALGFFALHTTRPEGTFLMAAALGGAVILYGGVDNRRLVRLVPYAVVCGALLFFYAIYVRRTTGMATINYRVHFIIQEFDFTRWVATAIRTISDVVPVMLGPVLLLFMGVGLFHRGVARDAPWRPHTSAQAGPCAGRDVRLELYVLYFGFAQWAVSLFVLSPEPRYLMSVIVVLSLWSARGITIVTDEAATLTWGRGLRLLPVTVTVLMMLLGSVAMVGAQYLKHQPSQPLEYKVAGLWMKENLDPGLIFTRKPQIGYYADMPSTGPDLNDTLEQAIARAKSAGAKYVVVDERYTAQMAPGLAPLLDVSLAPPDVRWLKTFSSYPQSRVVIYELAGTPGIRPSS